MDVCWCGAMCVSPRGGLGADSGKKQSVGRDDRGGWQLFLCGRQASLFVHLSVGISHFLRDRWDVHVKRKVVKADME